jgi:hypothetical protein
MQRLIQPLFASLTLGLAPFAPEPHILGKLRWIAGGAVGMGGMDWFDVLLHGAPWVWLLVSLGLVAKEKLLPPAAPKDAQGPAGGGATGGGTTGGR